MIVWQHRWKPAIGALALFTVLNLAWLLPMLHAVGGWEAYREQSADFAYSAGLQEFGLEPGAGRRRRLRYAVKMALAIALDARPGVDFRPSRDGPARLARDGKKLAALAGLERRPAAGLALAGPFRGRGVQLPLPPVLVALLAIGIGRVADSIGARSDGPSPGRLSALAAMLAAVFLSIRPTFERPGWRGDFDLAVARYTRVGLHAEVAAGPRRAGGRATRSSMPGLRAN